jgi:cellulose synthase operon protein C
VLKRIAPLVLIASLAQAQDDDHAIRVLERLTVGVSDQFLGQLSPDGAKLYFVTNRNTVREIYAQEIGSGRATALFDEGADVTWPRVSPDGKRLLYISYRDDAGGQLCIRDFKAAVRRCLFSHVNVVQAQWVTSERIVLVHRETLQGDLSLVDVTVHKKKLSATPRPERNLNSPAITPDGKWLVYVPVERIKETDRIGPGFAARAAKRLDVVRLDRPLDLKKPEPAVQLPVDLPGRIGQPVFSPDGKFLYFAQFFNDTNHDGSIDASDHAVLFRIPFEGDKDDAPARAAKAFPTQLTDASWNCQYPAPSPKQLVATCSRTADLDIYAISLEGAIPGNWNADRLKLEIELSSRRPEQLLLYRHLLERQDKATDKTARRSAMLNLIQLHLELDESEAAEFYGAKIGADKDKATAGVASALKVFLAHRSAVKARERGRTNIDFVDESRKRLESLPADKKGSPTGMAFRRVVRSEILDTLGDKESARKELDAVVLDEVTLPPVLEAYADRADELYRALDDAPALVAALRKLSVHPALPDDERSRYARATVRAMVRGLSYDEAAKLVTRELTAAPPDSEIAFALELSQLLLAIRDDKPPRAVRETIKVFYDKQTRRDRQRAVMMDAAQRASDLGAEKLVEDLVQSYIDDVASGTQERRRVERLYQKVMEGRAYRHLTRGNFDKARDAFVKVAMATGSLESHVGYIDACLKLGRTASDIDAEYVKADSSTSASPVTRFARAYLIALMLPKLDGEQHKKMHKEATTLLRGSGNKLKTKPEYRALMGALQHELFIEDGNLASAQRADNHYMVALELTRRNPRQRATLLQQLGLLHAQAGNWRIALGYLEDRDKLPFVGDAGELAHRIAKARVLFHLERTSEAVKAAEGALAACAKNPALAEYRALALSRAALYNLAAERFPRALELYDEELALAHESPRNRVVLRLARAAAAVGAARYQPALDDLGEVDRALADPAIAATLKWPHVSAEETMRGYRLMAAGLRAKAHRGSGDLEASTRALETRRALVAERYKLQKLDEDLRTLALIEAQLSDVAEASKQAQLAIDWMKKALAHADEFVAKTKLPVDSDQLDLLWMAAELRLSTGVRVKFKLPSRLRAAHDQMVAQKDPKWRSYQSLLEAYIGIMSSGKTIRADAKAVSAEN